MVAPSPDNSPKSEQSKTQSKTQSDAQPVSTRAKLVLPILITCLVILVGIYSPWVLYISFALLPTLLIRAIDKSDKRVLSFSVTGLNVTGLMLALQHSFSVYGSSPVPGLLFKDWVNWVLPFGLAWVGILFFMAFPVVFATVMEINLRHKEQRLKEKQRALLETWGTQLTQRSTSSSDRSDKEEEEEGEDPKD